MEWLIFDSWVEKPGQSVWLEKGWLTQTKVNAVNLFVHWKVGEDQP
jgi:hypothetical protein